MTMPYRVIFYGKHLRDVRDLGTLTGLKVAEDISCPNQALFCSNSAFSRQLVRPAFTGGIPCPPALGDPALPGL
jgi:hypothetical protein